MALAAIGAALLMIVCCALPALIAAGALPGIGGFLGNRWAIAAAVLFLVAAVSAAVRRRRAGRDACCLPTGSTKPPRHRDRRRSQRTRQGPRSRSVVIPSGKKAGTYR